MNRICFFISSLLVLAVSCKKENIDSHTVALLEAVSADDIRSHVAYLSDDKLQGRSPGTEGYQLAVDYVVNQLKENDIEPAGDNGSYFQKILIRRAWNTGSSSIHAINGSKNESLVPNQDYTITPHLINKQTVLDAGLVFAGYGISAPDLHYDDYSGIDAKGKIVVILRGTPKNIELPADGITDVRAVAASHGAAGVILVSSEKPRVSRKINKTLTPDGQLSREDSLIASGIQLFATVTSERLNQWFQYSGLDTAVVFSKIREGEPASKLLSTKLRIKYTSKQEDYESENILGKVEGSDKNLKNEYVVHSAHLDHLGVGIPIDGDSIYNGAHDNASGVAFTIEVAKIYAKLKEKPKRTIIFNFVTGEEIGMLGSAYFAEYPTVERQNIVAAINIDMPTIIAPFLSASAIGSEHSSLLQPVLRAGKFLNIDIEPDPEPKQNRFVRSDQFSFAKAGIPAIRINNGNKTANGENNLDVKAQEWRAKYYHKPQDDINGIFDFEAGTSYVRINFLISYFVAQDVARPTWNENSIYNKEK